ncbi:hypothetical protein OU995_25910 [Roseateles sp. SL47]|uniref:hypothetical protein n=1 Tax=Roseateles sp. SL47 TaxID=2995138 RepID=UPI0022706051|nr:hypothetical protein [Roseateles sp. SL47]WAC72907.1 hypothetical protein OU995_25910 [Roseateles sp. SL47]
MSFEGDRLEGTRQAFERFRETPAFMQVWQQLQERVDDCERFAAQHFSRPEANAIIDKFRIFKRHLLEDYGATYFANHLRLLFGCGKREFDRFCLSLAQADIALHQRKTALRELASSVRACQAAYPAFKEAADALDQREGGLRSLFFGVLNERINALLREFVVAARARTSFDWMDRMEVHEVNRLRLELGLPGGHLRDPASLSGVRPWSRSQLQDCADFLEKKLAPGRLLEDLAERCLQQLMDRLPPLVRQLPADADLNEYMPVIHQAIHHLNASFPGVRYTSLLSMDADTSQTHWRTDRSLVAMDLLRSLTDLGVLVHRPPSILMQGQGHEGRWQLRHLDHRLFHVSEQLPQNPEPELSSVGLAHVQAWPDQAPRDKVWRRLLRVAVANHPPADLRSFSPQWLDSPSVTLDLLRRMGPEHTHQWLKHQTAVDDAMLRLLLPALSQLGMGACLKLLYRQQPQRSTQHWLSLAGGASVLRDAAEAGHADAFEFWLGRVIPMLHAWSPGSMQELFAPARGATLVNACLTRGQGAWLQSVMTLLLTAQALGRVTPDQMGTFLRASMQSAMGDGHVKALRVFGDTLLKLVDRGGIVWNHLPRLLQGHHTPAGCRAAIKQGRTEVLQWFFPLVLNLHAKRCLTLAHATEMVACNSGIRSSASLDAIEGRHPETLAVFLDQIMGAFSTLQMPTSWLVEDLHGQRPDGNTALALMLQRPDCPCLPVWKAAILNAYRAGVLSRDHVSQLIGAKNRDGEPLIHAAAEPELLCERAFDAWLDLLASANAAGAVGSAHVEDLLAARASAPPALTRTALRVAMVERPRPTHVSLLVRLYARACETALIGSAQLGRLLGLDQWPLPPLIEAIQDGREQEVYSYLNGLLTQAQANRLPADLLAGLLQGAATFPASCLGTAILQPNADLLRHLLAALRDAAAQRWIPLERWKTLMLGEPGAPDLLNHLRAAGSDAHIRAVASAVEAARIDRLLSEEEADTLQDQLEALMRPTEVVCVQPQMETGQRP